jgi:hypothetical protein
VPFTPFHMGPGCAVKAVLGRRFSLTVFGFAQVATDLEPLVRMMRGELHVHGWSHTYLCATLIGAASLLIGRPVCQWLLRFWPTGRGAPFLDWLRGSGHITWTAAATGAFIGTSSHILIDSIMHADMQPFAPFAEGNRLLWVVTPEGLHLLCAASGAIGLFALTLTYRIVGMRDLREPGA